MQRPYWHGDRVRLRPVTTSDWELLYREDDDTEGIRALEPGVQLPRTPEQVQTWVAWAAEQRGQDEFVLFSIETHDGDFVGSANLHERDGRHGTFSYAVRIFRPHRRRGYAADASRILLRYAFLELRMQKANATTIAFNVASVRLQEALGFQQEGRRRRMVFSDGSFHDEILFGLTREEFEAGHPGTAGHADGPGGTR